MRIGRAVLALVMGIAISAGLAPDAEPLGRVPAALLPPAPVENASRVLHARRGDTLMALLLRAGVAAADAQDAIEALRKIWNPRALQVDQEVALDFDSSELAAIRIFDGLQRSLRVARGEDGHFSPFAQPRELLSVPTYAHGTIKISLYDAATAASMPPTVLAQLVHLFSYDVDFQREIQPGDSFEVLFERLTSRDGKDVAAGDILYAAMTLSGSTLRLYRYAPPDEDAAFFNERGESVQKALLRTPVDGAHLTSGFGLRHHPILGYTAMHRGVDFGAPAGAPIMAAGDGVVEKAGPNGSYGNYVLLRHGGGYETAYAHMRRFAAGIRPGAHVHQGQVIGYVGATGRATGPHLHYEIHVAGKQVNPLTVKMKAGRKLEGDDLEAFRAVAEEDDHRLLVLRDGGSATTAAASEPTPSR